MLQVPSAASHCNCAMAVKLSGPDMRLSCPQGNLNTSNFAWQLASRMRYTCFDGKAQQQLLDYLVSPANGLDKIDTTSIARGDGSAGPASQDPMQKQKFWQSQSATIAGAVVGTVVGVVLFSVLIWFIVGRRIMATRKAQAFQKFEEDHVAAATADAAAAAGGGAAASTAAVDPAAPRGGSAAGAHM